MSLKKKPAEAQKHPDIAEMNQGHSDGDSFALLKMLAEISAVFVAFTFIGGWSYLSSYYSAFGVNPLELEIPIPVVSTTAIYVLFEAKWPLVLVAILIVGWGVASSRFRQLSRKGGPAMLGLVLITISTASVIYGRQRAAEDALITSNALPFVAFASKSPQNDQPPCVDFQTYGSLDCKLLLHTHKTYYFFSPIPDSGEGNLNVFTMRDSDVLGVHILRGLERNAVKE